MCSKAQGKAEQTKGESMPSWGLEAYVKEHFMSSSRAVKTSKKVKPKLQILCDHSQLVVYLHIVQICKVSIKLISKQGSTGTRFLLL
jgi:hypothetical protein